MKRISHYQELIDYRYTLTGKIGLVPTMGNLHEGHLSLIKASANENDYTIVSIYVNPKQFGPNEDFAKYPRTLESDIKKIESLNATNIIIFQPTTLEQVFGSEQDQILEIPLKGLDKVLCGKHRPGHFTGVVTVVKRLFDLSKPTNGYFGLKDFQQVLIIEKIVKHFALPIKIRRVPIMRDESGLALSSRNQYIVSKPNEEKLYLNSSVRKLSKLIVEKHSAKLIEGQRQAILQENSGWDYLEILDAKNLKAVTEKTKDILIAGAFTLGQSRLLDNLVVNLEE